MVGDLKGSLASAILCRVHGGESGCGAGSRGAGRMAACICTGSLLKERSERSYMGVGPTVGAGLPAASKAPGFLTIFSDSGSI